ncbi:ranBP-type and C3HC4-type zinc finger-containing protein 1 [Caerostris darwini]|uniref:RanBP-type and C3HC4-type zinc finger-containing protein 1 n=1 Tax=Caerostris darwini TaxID=1538125 RepID=A0AAV4MZF7_9ARAC|nr:ranBP-type and C3HC4-type zinc finger-containing protein 1 [Caerostris darwini]
MNRNLCSDEDNLFNRENEIPWVTSGLYDSNKEECKFPENKDTKKIERTQFIYDQEARRQSEPIISKFSASEISIPKLQSRNCTYKKGQEIEKIPYLSNEAVNHLYTNSAENSPKIRKQYERTIERCFFVNLYIEARNSHLGPFPFEIHPKMNIRLLKLKVEKELQVPASFQKWIINNLLAIDNDLLLKNCNIVPGSPIFLYMDSAFENTVDVNRLCSLAVRSAFTNREMLNPVGISSNLKQLPIESVDYGDNKNISDKFLSDMLTKDKSSNKSFLNEFGENGRKKEKAGSFFKDKNFSYFPVSNPSEFITEEKYPTKDVKSFEKRDNVKLHQLKPPIEKLNNNSKLRNNIPNNADNFKFSDEASTFSATNSNITSSSCKILNRLIKSSGEIEIAKDYSERRNDKQSLKSRYNSMDYKVLEPKKYNEIDMKQSSVISSINANKSSAVQSSSKQSSILQKVRSKHNNKLVKGYCNVINSNQSIQSQITGNNNRIAEEFSLSTITENKSQNEVPSQFNLFKKHPLKNPCKKIKEIQISEDDNISTNQNASSSFNTKIFDVEEANKYYEERSDHLDNFVDIIQCQDIKICGNDSSKSSMLFTTATNDIEDFHTYQNSNTNTSNDPKLNMISVEDNVLEVNDFKNVDAPEEHLLTEVSIENNDDQLSFEILTENSDLSEKIDASSENDMEQNVKEENVKNIKESTENYEFLLKMENLNLVKNIVNFTCPICFGDFESDQGVILHECLHTFCIDCLAKTVDYADEVVVKCPYRDDEYSCQSYLQQREIKALVSPEIYERYLQRSIITAESLAEKSFHCKTPDCAGWCMFEDNINVFHCPVCFHYNCLNCRTIHEGLNCRQYQDKLKSQKRLDPDSEKTLEFLNKMIESGKALKCPKCDVVLMKKWGCDWLKCSVCLTEICWITKGPRWGPGGQGDTSAGCRCGVNGVKCHPSCTYCH